MINTQDILETINMIREENLDIRTITMEYLFLTVRTRTLTRRAAEFTTRYAVKPKTSSKQAKR